MEWLVGWLKENKDAMLALAGLISPFTALLAAFVSYRAVVTGPRIQREIAQEQYRLTDRQIAVQEATVALSDRKMRADLLGSYDQNWIDTFRATLAELVQLIMERMPIIDIRKNNNPEYQSERLIEIGNGMALLIVKLRLLLGSSNPDHLSYITEIRNWADPKQDLDEWRALGHEIITRGNAIIAKREEQIASRTDANSAPGMLWNS
jgi:hypothetical protein